MSDKNMSNDIKPQPPMARVGRFLMLDMLGEGAFGKVRLAVDETSGMEYAIKIMDKNLIKAKELTLQVRREIAVMKAMRHDNIVNLHQVLTSSNNLYMVMDLVTGGELFDAVAEKGRLPEPVARLYFQQLVNGVHYCHTRRVYHRDLKPENLLLSADKKTLKITDFGLSSIKAHNSSSELLHTIMGSPHYIAPEIITSAAEGYEGAKVDVWASGVILYGMLAGYLPFDENNTRSLYKAIVQNAVKYPPHFSYDVIKLLKAMLNKEASKRPSMEQVKTFTWFKVNYSGDEDKSLDKKRLRTKLRKHAERAGRKKKDKDRDKDARDAVVTVIEEDVESVSTPRQIGVGEADGAGGSSGATSALDMAFASRASVVVEICTQNLQEESTWNEAGRTEEGVVLASQAEGSVDTTDGRQVMKDDKCAERKVDKAVIADRIISSDQSFSALPRTLSHDTRGGSDIDRPAVRKRSDVGRSMTRGGGGGSERRHSDVSKSFSRLSNVARQLKKARGKHGSGSSTGSLKLTGAKVKIEKLLSKVPSAVRILPRDLSGIEKAAVRDVDKNPVHKTAVDKNLVAKTAVDKTVVNKNAVEKTAVDKIDDICGVETKTVKPEEIPAPIAAPVAVHTVQDQMPDRMQDLIPEQKREQIQEQRPDRAPAPAAPTPSPLRAPPPAPPPSVVQCPPGQSIPSSVSKLKAAVINCKAQCESPTLVTSPLSQATSPSTAVSTPTIRPPKPTSSMIFKPMRSGMAASLISKSSESRADMSPHVLCPDIEEIAGGGEWCIDSNEVFADVEDGDVGKVKKQKQKKKKKKKKKEVEEVTVPKGGIFGPLDTKLQFKLLSSIDVEANSTRAMRDMNRDKR